MAGRKGAPIRYVCVGRPICLCGSGPPGHISCLCSEDQKFHPGCSCLVADDGLPSVCISPFRFLSSTHDLLYRDNINSYSQVLAQPGGRPVKCLCHPNCRCSPDCRPGSACRTCLGGVCSPKCRCAPECGCVIRSGVYERNVFFLVPVFSSPLLRPGGTRYFH